MNLYNVSLHLIIRYDEEGEPVCQLKEFEVAAETEHKAIMKARELDKSKYSINEEYADQVEIVKASDLKEYMLNDNITNPSEAYITIDGEQYLKIECLKTYLKKDLPVS